VAAPLPILFPQTISAVLALVLLALQEVAAPSMDGGKFNCSVHDYDIHTNEFLVVPLLHTAVLVASRLSEHAHRESLLSPMVVTVLRG
jgi:hypothetical protein